MLPLILRLKKETHRKIARAQDMIIEELYRAFNEAVLHGGTAIWRCYGGLRFSEDIDVYLDKNVKQIDAFFHALEQRGFVIEKRKMTQNSLYSSLMFERCNVRFEALFKKVDSALKEYETADGNILTVYTLTLEDFICEKVDAYLDRMKIRDLYDVFFLLQRVSAINPVRGRLQKLIDDDGKPVDENDLKVLIITGLVPTSEKMLEYIKSRIEHG